MIDELIKQAKEIEQSSNANIQGSFIQVTNELTVDECEVIFKERCGDNTRKAKRYAKKITRVRDEIDPRWFNVGQLRNDVLAILETVLRELKND